MVRNEAYLTSNLSRKSKAFDSMAEVVPIKPGNLVVVVEHQSTKSSSEHHAMSLLEQGHGKSNLEASMGSRNRGIK
ncbi:hypothetical protein GQ457_07G008940 [Hibiscus cannabinus]